MKFLAISFFAFVIVSHAAVHQHKAVEVYSADSYHKTDSGQPQHDFQLGGEQS